jgi:hypothetical protein
MRAPGNYQCFSSLAAGTLIEKAGYVSCDVLYKPVEMDQLARKIDELLTKPGLP